VVAIVVGDGPGQACTEGHAVTARPWVLEPSAIVVDFSKG
jgi:hypothetical protein